jgi:ABC-2 type transport system ATP-binding protein
MSADLAIESEGLAKSYGSVPVLAGLDLRVPAASCYALLGRNGAGKTTTVRILSTLVRPDAGRATVAGCDLLADTRTLRGRISLSGQYAGLDGLQTGNENLRMVARLAGIPRRLARRRAAEMTGRFGLDDAADRRVATYSGGMRRRLDLAASLMTGPAVIFLDEPTTGLDLPSRLTLWEMIRELRSAGVTIFLTTQYLEEADQLADRIAVLDGGRVVADGTPGDLKHQVASRRLEVTLASRAAFDVVAAAARGPRLVRADSAALTVSVRTDGTGPGVRGLLDELDPAGQAIASFEVLAASLDDVFLALTGHTGQRLATGKEVIGV